MELALKNESEKRQALMSELQSLKQLDKKLDNGLSSFFCVIFFEACRLLLERPSHSSQLVGFIKGCAFTV